MAAIEAALRTRYADFGATLASEKLREIGGVREADVPSKNRPVAQIAAIQLGMEDWSNRHKGYSIKGQAFPPKAKVRSRSQWKQEARRSPAPRFRLILVRPRSRSAAHPALDPLDLGFEPADEVVPIGGADPARVEDLAACASLHALQRFELRLDRRGDL